MDKHLERVCLAMEDPLWPLVCLKVTSILPFLLLYSFSPVDIDRGVSLLAIMQVIFLSFERLDEVMDGYLLVFFLGCIEAREDHVNTSKFGPVHATSLTRKSQKCG